MSTKLHVCINQIIRPLKISREKTINMPKARRKSPRTSKRTKTNAADERAGAVIESLTSDVDAKEKMLEEMTLAG